MAEKEALITVMPSRTLVNLLLAALIIIAAGLLLLEENGRQPQQQALSEINTDTVDRILVERDDGTGLTFRKNGPDWFLTEPVHLHAKPARIEAILGLPKTISLERIPAADANLEVMHLAPPLLNVHIGDHTFRFGSTDPIKQRRYVLQGQTVHLIDDRLFHQLTQPAAFFAHNQLLPGNAAITQITYPGHSVLLEGDRWRSSPGPVVPGTDTAVLVENWRQAEAQRVLPYRKTDAAGRVIIKTTDRVVIFDIVAANHGLLLARTDLGLQYQLSADTAASLGLADYLRE